jgi:hypothetical protein
LLRDVAAALARRGAGRDASKLTIQLGRMLIERGRSKDAFDSFEESIRPAQADSAGDLVVSARLWQATTRIADAAFVEAEALCRAVLEAKQIAPDLTAWAGSVLAEALLWQGRVCEAPDLDVRGMAALDPVVAAHGCDVRMRCLLAQAQVFEAGRRMRPST